METTALEAKQSDQQLAISVKTLRDWGHATMAVYDSSGQLISITIN